MTAFALYVALLIAVTLAFVLPPLWLACRAPETGADRQATNLGIFRDQLAELDREKQEGSLVDSDYEQAKGELQRRLLQEVAPEAGAEPAKASSSRKLAIALFILLPILSLSGYLMLGNPKALSPEARVGRPQMTAEQIAGMVERLAEKMQANPDDMQGWLMLARSYKSMGRYSEAVSAYAKAESVIGKEPDLLASYAETLALASGKGLLGKPRQLVEKSLKINPQHPHSLFLAGAAAMEAGDNKQGVAYWEALLPMVDPGSDVEAMLRDGITKMKGGK
jgi:cytochrome c-type biogenesis protein CcmH